VLAPRGYDAIVAALEPGDLLYIRNTHDQIAHVVIWLGHIGVDPSGVPLVIDCTESAHRDSNGETIPIGVQIRPFTGWYTSGFDHAHRIVDALAHVTMAAAPSYPEGGDAGLEKGRERQPITDTAKKR
jgi:hypothetical protein